MTMKFKLGQKVWCLAQGVCEITSIHIYPGSTVYSVCPTSNPDAGCRDYAERELSAEAPGDEVRLLRVEVASLRETVDRLVNATPAYPRYLWPGQ